MNGSFRLTRSLGCLLIVFTLLLNSGCALILSGPKQEIAVHTNPEDVSFLLDNKKIKAQGGYISLDKRKEIQFVTVQKEGYTPSVYAFNREINPAWPWIDALWLVGAPVAWGVDCISGAWYKIEPNDLYITLHHAEGGDE